MAQPLTVRVVATDTTGTQHVRDYVRPTHSRVGHLTFVKQALGDMVILVTEYAEDSEVTIKWFEVTGQFTGDIPRDQRVSL